MGIDERDYIRNRPPAPGAYGRGGLSAMRMWSVNTWLIIICAGVFVIDEFAPRNTAWYKPVQVSRDVAKHIDVLGGGQYVEQVLQDEPGALRSGRLVFQRAVVDRSATPFDRVGTVTYQWMPPLQRWFHFSTDTAFRRLEVWRFIGFQFLHGTFTHLLFNMIALYFFGSIVEKYLGGKRYLAFYLLCGICGALLYLVLNLGGVVASLMAHRTVAVPGLLSNSMAMPLVGASAGVFGVLMAGAFLVPNAVVLVFFILPMRLATLAYAFVALALVSVIFSGQNAGGHAGHLGGAIAGFYFIRHPHKLHGFFDFLGWVDPTSHHYRGRRSKVTRPGRPRKEVDRILDKISSSGLHSLTDKEKRVLREASEK